MEADDDRVRGPGQQHVALGDGAHPAMDDLDFDFGGGELGKGVRERFGRSALVRLDDDVEDLDLTLAHLPREIFQRDAPAAAAMVRFTVQPLSLLGDLPGFLGVGDDDKGIARLGNAVEAQDLHRHRRPRGVHPVSPLIEQGPHSASEMAANQVIADLQRPALDQHGRHRALAWIQAALDHRSLRRACGIRLLVQQLRLQQDLLQKLLDPLPRLGGDRGRKSLPSEILQDHVVRQEVLLHFLDVRRRQVGLVDGHHDRHAGVLGVADRLDRLRHDLVVRCHHQDDDVGDLRPPRPHGRERLVAWGVQEGDPLSVGSLDVVGADVLSNASGLAGDDVRLAHVVKQ